MAKSKSKTQKRLDNLVDDLAEDCLIGITQHQIPADEAISARCRAQFAYWFEKFDGDVDQLHSECVQPINNYYDRDEDRYSAIKDRIDTDGFDQRDYGRLAALVRLSSEVERIVFRELTK